jgi:hypothetical protein
MLKPQVISKLLVLIFAASFSAKAQKSIAEYVQVRDINRDGQPSRCDCDYHKKSLVFNRDSTFVFEEVKGRLDPEKQLGYRGTWKIENDSVVVLQVTHTWDMLKRKEEKREAYLEHYTLDKYGRLFSYSEQWEGHGLLRTSQQPLHQKR